MDKPLYIDSSHYRFDDYTRIIALYEGEAFTEWGMNEKDYFKHFHKNNTNTYIYYNFFKVYTEKLTEIVLGKNFNVTTGDVERDKAIHQWIQDNDYLQLQTNKLLYGNLLGDSPVKWYRDGENVHADYITPNHWYPIMDKYNVNLVRGHALVFAYAIDKNVYYLIEEHTANQIKYKAFNSNWVQAGVSEIFPDLFSEGYEVIEETKVSVPLVSVYKNSDTYNSPFGSGDFDKGSMSLVYNIADTMTGIHSTNSMTRDPIYNVPNGTIQGILDQRKGKRLKKTDGGVRTNHWRKDFSDTITESANISDTVEMLYLRETLADMLTKTKAFEKTASGESVEVVQHNPLMDNSFSEIKVLKGLLYEVMSVAPILIDSDFRVGDLSGIALRNLANATLKKASRKSKALIKSVKTEMKILQELLFEDGALPVTVTISDGLATEPQDDIIWITPAIQAGLISKQDAIAILMDLSTPEAMQKVELLRLEVDNAVQPIN